jgi:hypothetical protein
MGCNVIAYYYVLMYIMYHYYYLEALEQAADVDGPQHGVDIQAATIRGQRRQSKATKVIGVKLVEEVGNFLREVAQLAVLTKPHLVGADHLLPPQRTPTDVMGPASSQMMGDLTPPLRPGPDIAADAQAAAMVRVLTSLRAQVGPPSVRPEGDLARLLGLVLPVVILEAFVAVVDAGCTDIAVIAHRLNNIMLYYCSL